MVEAFGARWTVEQCFEEAKGEVGLGEYEVLYRTISERYRILLPDGLELRQVEDRFQQISQLFIVLEKIPHEEMMQNSRGKQGTS